MVCCGGYVRNPNPCIYEIGGRNHLSRFAEFAKVPLVVACNLTETPPDGYRRNVGICLVNSSRKIFTASRINIRNTWQMPQGGADDGEDLRKAAMRELTEETGVTSAEFLAEVPYWLTYDFPMQVRYRLNRRWGTNYKGQAQKWFLFKFTGKEEEINLLGDGSEKPEFNDWSWMWPERVVELVSSHGNWKLDICRSEKIGVYLDAFRSVQFACLLDRRIRRHAKPKLKPNVWTWKINPVNKFEALFMNQDVTVGLGGPIRYEVARRLQNAVRCPIEFLIDTELFTYERLPCLG